MYAVRNLNYANRSNRVWRRANHKANQRLYFLLLKEGLKLMPALLLCKIGQYKKVSAFMIAWLVLLFLPYKKGYVQIDPAAYWKKPNLENKHYLGKKETYPGSKPNFFNLRMPYKIH